ncbi:pancreatic beta cell growth factor isoform X2 [Austrofundulus limnaeus]|uniref:Pancreatic beta cell growth factor isoform X2 n=1 Tax=Austrofundulus limnaeus TaxID=52670 RepID=A0A2I4B6U8_AUSLI|nr:PREDICTED: pancreatic beta cell growth factor-like isoform X2 [Austrofundulus limnaeus]
MNQTLLDEVKSFLGNNTDWQDGVWVGLERSIFGTDLDWMWVSDSKAENLNWNSSFPVDRFNNHCGKMILDKESKQIQFLDANCHDELPFVCQGPV